MDPSDGLLAHVLDLLSPWGGVSARRMFSGHGLFRDGVMFALLSGGSLYLKTAPGDHAAFEAAGMRPFSYRRKTRDQPVELSYWQAPPGLLDDGEEMIAWARNAWAAARAAQPARSRSRPPPKMKKF